MSKLLLEAARWVFAALSLICILAVWILNPRSGPTLALFSLFVLFGALAVMISLHLPFFGQPRKRTR